MNQLINNNSIKVIVGIGIFFLMLTGCKDPIQQPQVVEPEITDNEIFEVIFKVSEGRLEKIEDTDSVVYRFELYQDLFSEAIKDAILKRNTFNLEESIVLTKEKAQAIFCLSDENYCLVETDFTILQGLYPLQLINPFGQRACDTFSWWYDVSGHSVNTYFTLCY